MSRVLFVRGKKAPSWEAPVLRELNDLGNEAKFLVSQLNGTLEESLQYKGINWASSGFIENSLNRSNLNRFLNYVLNVKTSEFTTRYFKSSSLFEGWEIAHLTDDLYSPGLQASRYIRNIVMTVWENIPFNYSIVRGYPTRKLRNQLFSKVKRFFPVTLESGKYLETIGVPSTKIEVIHPGIDVTKFKEKKVKSESVKKLVEEDKKIILGVARIEYAKGLTYTLRALKELKRESSDFVYVHIGSGSTRFSSYLSEMVQKMGLQENVRFLGNVDYDLMPEYYNACTTFILPSIPSLPWEEQLGFSLLEAMASKKCVLISSLPSLNEVVPENCGLRFAAGDYMDMHSKLSKALSDDDLRKEFGKNARERVTEEFNAKVTAKRYSEAYESLLTN